MEEHEIKKSFQAVAAMDDNMPVSDLIFSLSSGRDVTDSLRTALHRALQYDAGLSPGSIEPFISYVEEQVAAGMGASLKEQLNIGHDPSLEYGMS